MDPRPLGKTGLQVSRLGFGLVQIGALRGASGLAEADRLLNTALDEGINFLDTSACYGDSEELIGNSVAMSCSGTSENAMLIIDPPTR